jgi:hypothetical protein
MLKLKQLSRKMYTEKEGKQTRIVKREKVKGWKLLKRAKYGLLYPMLTSCEYPMYL